MRDLGEEIDKVRVLNCHPPPFLLRYDLWESDWMLALTRYVYFADLQRENPDNYDVEIFDDNDLYHQLLRDLIAARSKFRYGSVGALESAFGSVDTGTLV